MASEKPSDKLDQIVARASRERVARDNAYRERALRMYPWVCGRCAREFDRENLRELTVHHRDHDHDNSPPDGSNWELLCVYCHDNEHSRLVDPGGSDTGAAEQPGNVATYNPFANLAALLKEKK
jgi:5-methylcytosine-specific restriction endonuclease McrA